MPPANFAGRIGAFIAELSYQLLGYSAYLMPIVLVVLGWHYFWCRAVDAAYTKLVRRRAALRLRVVVPVARVRHARHASARRSVPAGTSATGSAALLAEYLNRTGSIILILTLLFLAIILSTQFSFGRLFAASGRCCAIACRGVRRVPRVARRTPARQAASGSPEEAPRQGAQGPSRRRRGSTRAGAGSRQDRRPAARAERATPAKKPSRTAAMVEAAAAALKAASSRPTPPRDDQAAAHRRSCDRRCRCPSPSGRRPNGRRAPTRCRRSRCSTRREANARSTSASSWTARGCSKRSAASSRSKDRSSRSIPARSSRPTSSSRTPASSTARSPALPTTCASRCRPSPC